MSTETVATLRAKVSVEQQLQHPGKPWWSLLGPEDQVRLAELTRGMFAPPAA